MTPELKFKINKCATLLAQSPLDEEIKKTILENINSMTEGDVDMMIMSLEREALELNSLGKEFNNFDQKQNEDWSNLEKSQEELAEKAVEETLERAKSQS